MVGQLNGSFVTSINLLIYHIVVGCVLAYMKNPLIDSVDSYKLKSHLLTCSEAPTFITQHTADQMEFAQLS